MKKIIFISLILILSSSFCIAQIQNGYSYNNIKKEYSNKVPETGLTSYGSKYLVYFFDSPNSSVIYYFDTEDVCNRTRIVPGDEIVLKVIIEHCNKNYVVISDKKWKWYAEEGIYDIYLVIHNEKYFIDYVLQ